MGNANSGGVGHRSVSGSGGLSKSTSRNPLQRGSNPPLLNSRNVQRTQKQSNSNSFDGDDDHENISSNFSVSRSQPPQSVLQAVEVSNGRSRRVWMDINNGVDSPQHPPPRQGGFRRSSATESVGANEESFASQASSVIGRSRLTLSEAREFLLSVFFPRQGQLECIASGFMTAEDYTLMHGFWAPFLTTDLRDKWYLDAVMLSVLGKDRWRSSRQQKEIIMSVAPSREQVLQLNQLRHEYNDQLRERLLDLCGSLVESHEHHSKKTNLQSLLEDYHRHKMAHPHGTQGSDGGGVSDDLEGLSSFKPNEATSSTQHQELLSLSLMRLQTTVPTSFDCFDLLASRIPTSVISSLPSNYFLNSTPVVYEAVAFQEKKVGDLDSMSFFMSLESRRRLLNGQAPDDSDRLLNTSLNDLDFAQPFNIFDSNNAKGMIGSARQLYAAVRHAGLVVTTACSSMVLTVMFHLAGVLRARQAYRNSRAKASQRGIALEQMICEKKTTANTYSGKPTDDVEELKRYAIRDEASLVVLTKALIERFKKENRAKMEKLRKRYPNLFAYLEAIAPKEEQEDFDVTRLLSGMVLKLMFLTGGGQRSIVADDRRIPGGINQVTDDVAISNMLEVPMLNRICWVACMLGMPIMSNHGVLAQKHQGKPLTYLEQDECCGVIRKLFQAVGALPCGNACPHTFREWFPMFPFYAVNAEGKRVLMYLYTTQVSAIQRVPLTIQKDMTLLSFAKGLLAAKGQGRVDIANYFFDPTLTVGFASEGKDDELNSTKAGVASPLAPKSIADTLDVNADLPNIDSTKLDRATPLSNSANCSAAVGQGSGDPAAKESFQCATAVSVGSPTSLNVSKTSPSKPSTIHQASGNNNSSASGPRKNTLTGDALSASSSSASLSCSTLLDDDRGIDVYTCVNPQMQLYMRCSNEATVRRHRTTELTPSVSAAFFHSQHHVEMKRPDIAPALRQAVPKLMPSEGFLVVRWTSAEPLVTFRAGDIVSAMVERTSPSLSGDSCNNTNSNAVPGSPSSGQPRSGSIRYFTGAARPSLGSGDCSAAKQGLGLSGVTNADDSSIRMPSSSPRVHVVTIDDSVPQGNSPRVVRSSLSDHHGGISPGETTNSKNNDVPFSGYNATSDDADAKSSMDSFNAPEKMRTYQGLMHEFLGVKEMVSRRLAVRWTIVDVLPSTQLTYRSCRLSTTAIPNGNSSAKQQQEQYRNEWVLHVAAVEVLVSFPMRILTIGHERAAMSVFTFLSPDSDAVCWANPRLIEAITNRTENSSRNDNPASATGGGTSFLQGSNGVKGPNGILCNTEEELHNVFFSIGVLLSNAIVNGVYFSAPIAPLAFLLMKKALNSGDYSFKSFMWLEPADGNLLGPALVLNSAYEILTMTEQQYVAFLQSRGMTNGDAHIFPVMHSLLDELNEDRVWQSTIALPAAPEDSIRRPRAPQEGNNSGCGVYSPSPRGQNPSDSTSLTVNSTMRERSLNLSQMSNSVHEYMKLIHMHNRSGSTFHRNQGYSGCSSAMGAGVNNSALNKTPHAFLLSANVSVQDRLQGYRNQQQQQQQKNCGQPLTPDSPNVEALYAKLPSRREYLFLYLVNDLAWGSVRRDGIGEKNKELWVSMARGFMTSAVAKSPLMTNCCSRTIREVLCVPRPGS